MGATVAALTAVIGEMNTQVAVLERELAAGFEQHPDAAVVRSLPGLGTILGARVLSEFGDAPDRYLTAKSRKNYAGTSPITRASGSRRAVLARHVRNRRLGVPRTFRTADPYRIFIRKDGITWQGDTRSSVRSFVRKQPGWSWRRHGR
jgi:transposase